MRALVLMTLVTGCPNISTGAAAPISPLDRFGTYRHAVEYEVDSARVRGEACAGYTVTDTEWKKSHDKGVVVNGYLFERAKVNALDNAKDADGMIEVRGTYVNGADGNECVVVTGRPYRVKSMRAVPSVASEEHSKPAPDRSNLLQQLE